MSTLTKVLIVLLTIASFVLCAIVVTYVSSSVNYKEKYDTLSTQFRGAKENEDNANKQFNDLKAQTDQEKLALNEKIAALQQEISKVEAKLKETEIARDDAQRRADSWQTATRDFAKTVEVNNKLRTDAETELKNVNAELIKERAQHEETATALREKMAIITQLEDKWKGLLEEKTELQKKLDGMLSQYGKLVAEPVAVTAARDEARVSAMAKDIDLKGAVTSVDLKNLLAEISIGQADGVKKGMRFHATRGDKFICDVVILDVEPEKAVGWLEMLQQGAELQPRVDDKVSTNL